MLNFIFYIARSATYIPKPAMYVSKPAMYVSKLEIQNINSIN
jgi:hypothetical protein